ncbi:TPA_asm: fusion protein [Hevea brasiliensis amalgavirus 1]|nr:TPA_asm: fusion protein [Hevea brasiliensis amalgavirus 1]
MAQAGGAPTVGPSGTTEGVALGGNLELAGFHGITDEEQATVEIREALECLIPFGVPVQTFTYGEVLASGLARDQFLRLIRILTSHTDGNVMELLLSEGIKKGFFPLPMRCGVKELISLCKYLKSGEGQSATQGIQQARKLAKKAKPGTSVGDAALVQVLNYQSQEFGNSQKKIREGFDLQLSELRKRIRRLERQKDAALAENRDAFIPAVWFNEPTVDELNLLCYKKYCEKAASRGTRPLPAGEVGYAKAREMFGGEVRTELQVNFVQQSANREALLGYLRGVILKFDEVGDSRMATNFVATWLQQVEKRLWALPLIQRRRVAMLTPVGRPHLPGVREGARPLAAFLPEELLKGKEQVGIVLKPALGPRSLRLDHAAALEGKGPRLRVLREPRGERVRGIPVARSKWECGVRKVIGGGEMVGWRRDSQMFRGGGDSSDALRLIAQARGDTPGSFLSDYFSSAQARAFLSLTDDLAVPDGPNSCVMKNYNNEATSGPFLRSFGIRGKDGLKGILESFMWERYDSFARGEIDEKGLPFFGARLGFRTKLMTMEVAKRKMETSAPLGRAVMMLDALEQAASSPLYNVLSSITFRKRLERGCGFKNTVVKASADWRKIWEAVKESECIVELDWSKFDRERPKEDLIFMIDVIISCFRPKGPREERLLHAYKVCMTRALVERPIIFDGGGILMLEGMVPSGSLWTGWLDTALNILYMKITCLMCDIPLSTVSVLCAGDDNLTLFSRDPGRGVEKLRSKLNEEFRAGISEDEFFIHRPPFHVTKKQAIFPIGTDLSKGTSRIIHQARWVEFEGELEVDVERGKSHRWEYSFKGKPKFLSMFWLPDGLPIRPARDNLEKLLWPEGIHDSIEKYEAAVIAMVVDNPFNHHNVNHLLARYAIIQQLKKFGGVIEDQELTMWMAKFRPGEEGICPFPEVGVWRKTLGHHRFEDYQEIEEMVKEFRQFMEGVSTLYAREAEGGIDAWKFMDIIRGQSSIGEGQFGNDIRNWVRWIHNHPVTRFLRGTKSFKDPDEASQPTPEVYTQATAALEVYRERLNHGLITDSENYAFWVSDRLEELSLV